MRQTLKHGPCPFGHDGPLITLPDGRGRLCPCGGAAHYDGDQLVGPIELIQLLDKLARAVISQLEPPGPPTTGETEAVRYKRREN